jgi:hypothetical protein
MTQLVEMEKIPCPLSVMILIKQETCFWKPKLMMRRIWLMCNFTDGKATPPQILLFEIIENLWKIPLVSAWTPRKA